MHHPIKLVERSNCGHETLQRRASDMTQLAEIDYFTDADVTQDPYAYWEFLRRQGPVVREPHHGVVAVTGYQEVQAAFKDVEAFSAVNAIGGPFPPLPFTPDGDDISA